MLDDVEVRGFKLGMITAWEAEPSDYGDTGDRWGVWYVAFPHAMDSRESARRNLEYVLLDLEPKWRQWSDRRL